MNQTALTESDNRFLELDQRIDTLIAAAHHAEGRVAKVVALANATREVTAAVKAQWESIKELKNSPLGFLTDEIGRDKPPYTDAQLQLAVTHGILLGAMPFNGEITVISGRAYLGVSHYRRRIAETASITDFDLQFGAIAYANDKLAMVEARVAWLLDGNPRSLQLVRTESLDRRIPIRVNAGMGVDAILGKAERKILKRVYESSTGRVLVDEDDDRTVEGTASPSQAPPSPPPAPKPEVDEMRERFLQRRSQIRAARTMQELDAIAAAAGRETWSERAQAAIYDELHNRQFDIEALGGEDAMKRYIAALGGAKTVKETGEIYDRFFGPDRSRDWSPADAELGVARRNERNAQIRGQA